MDYKTELLKLREDLSYRIGQIADNMRTPLDADWKERAVQMEDDEVLSGLEAEGLQELRMIDFALKRIEDGTYGTCIQCHKPIAEARLNAIPYAVKCRHCA